MALQQNEQLILTVEEVAQKLRIGRSLAWRLVQEGQIPSVRLGRLVRIPQRELDDWIHRHSRDRTEGVI